MAALLLVFMLVLAALALDLGVLCIAKTELQRSADAAALAATEELLWQTKNRRDYSGDRGKQAVALLTERNAVREMAALYAGENEVGRAGPALARNFGNDERGEIVIGELMAAGEGPGLAFKDPDRFNSVLVRVNRTADRNGEVSLFFGRVIGRNSAARSSHAQAAFLQDFRGFRVPSGDPPPTIMILPFAVEESAWKQARNGNGPDDYAWDADTKKVVRGSDWIAELSLFPLGTGAGGNFGTVDIGSNNSTTPTLRRQIVDGVTHDDLAFHGGELALDNNGKLQLSGDPGLKLGAIQPSLRKIIGQSRIIPLYNSVTGGGNQARFNIVGFAGARVLDVQLTGSTRYLRMQSAPIITRGGIEGKPGGSTQIFSPVKLVD